MKSQTQHFLYLILLAAFSFQSCQNSFDKIEEYNDKNGPVVPEEIGDATAPEGFNFESSAALIIEISAVEPNTEIPVPRIPVSIWVEDDDMIPTKLAHGSTNSLGRWKPNVVIPNDRDSIMLLVEAVGYPNLHRIAINKEGKTTYTLGADNENGRVVPQAEPTGDGGLSGGEITARANLTFMGTFNRDGVPDYLTTNARVWPSVLEFINVNLPEGGGGVPANNPQYLDPDNYSSIHMLENGEVWITFAHEGAGYKNSLGFFTFDRNNPPASKNDVDVHTIIFPNVSYERSGGGLVTGNRVYLGTFQAGTSIGWFLIPNGYNSGQGTVSDRPTTRYSLDHLNTFTATEHQKHMVMLPNTQDQVVIIGIEDLNRPSGDNDFNDAVFIVEANPFSAIDLTNTPEVIELTEDTDGDGIIDINDSYPNDPTKAFDVFTPAQDVFGTLAYEDMWPKKGDYDFNDLVADYNINQVLNADNEVTAIKMRFMIRAFGSSLNHGFALQLPIDPAYVASVEGQILNDNDYVPVSSQGVELGMSTTVIPIFTDGFGLFSETKGIINTDPGKKPKQMRPVNIVINFSLPIPQEQLGTPPYDLFMLRGQDRTHEIHRVSYKPTEKADMSLFNSEEDDSNIANGHYFLDKRNFPWVLNIPTEFIYPPERKKISDVYNNFIQFATFGGTTDSGWFRNNIQNVNQENGY